MIHVVPPKKDVSSSPSLVGALEKSFSQERNECNKFGNTLSSHFGTHNHNNNNEVLMNYWMQYTCLKEASRRLLLGSSDSTKLFSTTCGSKFHVDMVAKSYVITRKHNIQECHLKLACNCPFIK